MSTSARKRHERKQRRRLRARLRSRKKVVRHQCLSGRTGTAHSKKTRPKSCPPQNGSAPLRMLSASLHALGGISR